MHRVISIGYIIHILPMEGLEIPILKKVFKKVTTSKNKDHSSGEPKMPRELTKKSEMFRAYISKNADIISRSFFINGINPIHAVVVYLEGVIDSAALNKNVLKTLMLSPHLKQLEKEGPEHLIKLIYQTSLTVGQVNKIDTLNTAVQSLFDRLILLMIDGFSEILVIEIRSGEHRSIEEPASEKTILGPRDGFIESLTVNVALIRQKLRDPNLIVKKTMVGKRTRTDVALLYIEDIADPEIVQEVKKRVDSINIDGVLATGYIEQFIEDNPFSLLPQIQSTERPDKVVANLLEGRVAIIVNGCPTVSILPAVFDQFLQSPEDYYTRPYIGSFSRIITHIAFFLAVSLPAIYIALLSFQQELIPFDLIVSLAKDRKLVPFPVAVEAFLQTIIINLVIETGKRMPIPFGQTVGVVGGIVLGQAAISAKLASPAIVIIISITTICIFIIPNPNMASLIRIIQIPCQICSASFGMFGFSFFWLIFIGHLVSLETVGVPYFAPFAPTRFADIKDSMFRNFIFKLKNRPASIPNINQKRQVSKNRKDHSGD